MDGDHIQHHPAKPAPDPDLDPPDAVLIDRVRAGDLEAYDPLYQRHAASALRHARHWTRTEAAAEDLRAEAFTRVLYAIRNGNGPTEAMRPYLLTTMRHIAGDWAEGDRRLHLVADPADLETPPDHDDPVLAALERSLAGLAFMTLPERWQTVLWHTEVEQEGPTQLTALLGIDAGAVAALAYRAREGLKQAYLQAHITEIGDPVCRPFAERLGAHARGRLARRERAKVSAHLRHCAECTGLFAMVKYVNGHLGALIAPAVLGTAAAAKTLGLIGSAAASGAAHAGLWMRAASRARHASPRQQAVAATTVAAVAAAALAFALTGHDAAAPKAAPAARPTPVRAAPASPAPPAPAPPPPPPVVAPVVPPPVRIPAPPPRPRPKPPRKSTPPPAPRPTPSPSPSPTPSPQTPSPSPSPSPTQTPVRVNCPGVAIPLLGVQVDLNLSLDLVDIVSLVEVDVLGSGPAAQPEPDCGPAGPPTPF
jgi:RNA polymerase sigma factor (sigma-70 family)